MPMADLMAALSSVPFQHVFLQGAGVDAHADGNPPLRRGPHHLGELLPLHVARVDPDGVGSVFHGRQSQPVVEVDVSHQGDGYLLADRLQGQGGLLVGDGRPYDLAACFLEGVNLPYRGPHVSGVRGCQGLDHHRRTAADLPAADHDGSGLPSSDGSFQGRTPGMKLPK
jgi:hypothetical protein